MKRAIRFQGRNKFVFLENETRFRRLNAFSHTVHGFIDLRLDSEIDQSVL